MRGAGHQDCLWRTERRALRQPLSRGDARSPCTHARRGVRAVRGSGQPVEKEREAAAACGYGFVIGVSTQQHKDVLLRRNPALNIVVTGCKR
ncbi:hypothetical protein D7V93_23025 [Corallococcus llansteffanensis]|uniref:DUF6310 domain-containing protein n=1 Tax=Corallococcus llansteffanensis TaxID=2316731 RepID=A0A3A8PGD8_9BACT|nr:hypothetical protein D7V93_23025 [Corallococcus llansteffanensis]